MTTTILSRADQRRVITRSEINRLRNRVIDCAAAWAEFQDEDSLADQAKDGRLRCEADDAATALRFASNEYGMAMARYYREREL